MPPDEHAINVLASLRVFADTDSNAVLDVLAGQIPQENEKFPKGELTFSNSGWRGFYHCHPAVKKHPQEHGHFHLFARCGEGQNSSTDWTHVAALSMDNEGQPRTWFTVNQWVTGANWLSASNTIRFLDDIQIPDELTNTERFLLSMLALYHDELKDMLHERDRCLTQVNAADSVSDKLHNRDVYVLSSQPIDLQQRLSRAVSC